MDDRKERYQSMVEGKSGFVAPNPGLQMPSWVMGTAPAMSHPIPPKHKLIHGQESGLHLSDNAAACSRVAFTPKALRAFSLAIGITESSLAVLVLDHNHLGDIGVEIIAAGLQRYQMQDHHQFSNIHNKYFILYPLRQKKTLGSSSDNLRHVFMISSSLHSIYRRHNKEVNCFAYIYFPELQH